MYIVYSWYELHIVCSPQNSPPREMTFTRGQGKDMSADFSKGEITLGNTVSLGFPLNTLGHLLIPREIIP
jgi:hypothetical protein